MPVNPVFDPKLILPTSSTKVRAFLRHNLSHDIWKGNTGSAILADLKARGLGIRAQDFFAIRRQVLSQDEFSGQISGVQPNEFVSQAQWKTDHGISLSTNLQYRFDVTGIDQSTGQRVTRTYNLGSDSEKTRAQVEAELFAILANDAEAYGLAVEKVDLDYVLVDPFFAGSR